ncbi:MAG: hypothetical protein FJ109_12110 [Deltaproteobacteria bacterium]|nr:hypothetical protein [Deltaproteobacteria bacterium]
MVRLSLNVLILTCFLASCSGGGDKDTGAQDVPGDVQTGDACCEDVSAPPDGLGADTDLVSGEGGAQDVVDADVPEPFPPRKLPFEYSRPMKGEPIPGDETEQFTKAVTGLWSKVGSFRWLLRTSTGVDPSTGKDDYLAWHNDVLAVKAGDTVTFKETGGEHNMWIPSSKVLSQAINGCNLTADWETCKVAEQYCKGLTASVKGFVWDENDPAPFLMARAIFPMDQSFTLDEATWKDDGRKKAMEFSGMYHIEDGWNAHTFAWPHNPTWGSIWITNMRSKDDVCAIVRTTAFLPYAVADAPFEWVREACQETLDTMKGFNKDIVDSGYYIRTKGTDGVAYKIPDQDLGNYVWYAELDPPSECTNRLATDLIAYGVPKTNDCGSGYGSVYDMVAPGGHYYNYPIIWNYHMAALGNALVYGHEEIALNLLKGMTERIDTYLDPKSEEPGVSNGNWKRDMALLLVQAAAFGFPLNWEEARLVQKHWIQAVAEFESWPNWDLWDESVPDGEYNSGSGFRPAETGDGVQVEAVAMFLEYCNSPFKNPAGATFVDCAAVADAASWGK